MSPFLNTDNLFRWMLSILTVASPLRPISMRIQVSSSSASPVVKYSFPHVWINLNVIVYATVFLAERCKKSWLPVVLCGLNASLKHFTSHIGSPMPSARDIERNLKMSRDPFYRRFVPETREKPPFKRRRLWGFKLQKPSKWTFFSSNTLLHMLFPKVKNALTCPKSETSVVIPGILWTCSSCMRLFGPTWSVSMTQPWRTEFTVWMAIFAPLRHFM